MKVAIEGKLNQSRWQAEDGTNRSKIEIIVDEIEFMSRQQGQTASKPVQQQPQQFAPQAASQPMQQQPQPQQFAPQTAPQPMQQFAPQPMQQPVQAAPVQAAPVQQAMPMMQQQAPQQVASIYDEDIPF